MPRKRKQPYIWVTWLSKVMAGEQPCLWASWFKVHFQDYEKAGDFDLAKWNIEHTRLLTATRMELARKHIQIRVEDQNTFRFEHSRRVLIAGRPDILAIEDRAATVLDCKTGRPKSSDEVQVQICMYLLPLCFPELTRYAMQGMVVYPKHRIEIPATAVNTRFKENLDYFVKLIAARTPPMKAPSLGACRFCDITSADCAERVEPTGSIPSTV